jgi:endogenous inhibitor of DNA gyrase (YacG/DUF329 family)
VENLGTKNTPLTDRTRVRGTNRLVIYCPQCQAAVDYKTARTEFEADVSPAAAAGSPWFDPIGLIIVTALFVLWVLSRVLAALGARRHCRKCGHRFVWNPPRPTFRQRRPAGP